MEKEDLERLMKQINSKPLPKHWDEFVKKITLKHNVIHKNGSECKCTNCNKKFKTGKIKISDIAECPHCNNRYVVIGNSLYYRGQSFNESIIVCQKINKKVVVRVFEIYSNFDKSKETMRTSMQEYARTIMGVGTYLSDAISFYMGYAQIYHYNKNTSWRKYDGVRDFTVLRCYPYNKKKLIQYTSMKYSPIKEFMNEFPSYNYLQTVNLAAYPGFESLWKMGLKELCKASPLLKKKGSFQKRFGVPKSFLPFMVKNKITYNELLRLQITQIPDIKIIRQYKYISCSKLKKLKKIIPLKYVNLVSQLGKIEMEEITELFEVVNPKKLAKYKEIKNNINIYIDYIDFIKKLGFDMSDTKFLFPKGLKELHDKYEKEIKIKENLETTIKIYQRFFYLSNYIYENDKYIIYPAPAFETFEEESRNQSNCVRQYASRYAESKTEIYFMRSKSNMSKSLVTVQCKDNSIVQSQQKSHKNLTLSQSEFLSEWQNYKKKQARKIKNLEATNIIIQNMVA